MTDPKKLKIVFEPGCFDDFEGSQEELDNLQAEILAMFESGELLENSKPVDIDALAEEDPELAEKLLQKFFDQDPRNLQ